MIFAVLVTVTGCGAQYTDTGPQAGLIIVEIQATAPQYSPTCRERYGNPTKWDMGLYLVDPDGVLRQLPPQPPQNLAKIQTEELNRRVGFAAPPGRLKLRLLASAWYTYWDGRGPNLVTLKEYSQDFELDLPPKGTQNIKARFGY